MTQSSLINTFLVFNTAHAVTLEEIQAVASKTGVSMAGQELLESREAMYKALQGQTLFEHPPPEYKHSMLTQTGDRNHADDIPAEFNNGTWTWDQKINYYKTFAQKLTTDFATLQDHHNDFHEKMAAHSIKAGVVYQTNTAGDTFSKGSNAGDHIGGSGQVPSNEDPYTKGASPISPKQFDNMAHGDGNPWSRANAEAMGEQVVGKTQQVDKKIMEDSGFNPESHKASNFQQMSVDAHGNPIHEGSQSRARGSKKSNKIDTDSEKLVSRGKPQTRAQLADEDTMEEKRRQIARAAGEVTVEDA